MSIKNLTLENTFLKLINFLLFMFLASKRSVFKCLRELAPKQKKAPLDLFFQCLSLSKKWEFRPDLALF